MIKEIEVGRVPNGYHQIPNASIVAAYTCPGNGRIVTIQADGGGVRYRPDGVAPTNTVGVLLLDKEIHTLIMGEKGKIQDIKIIEQTPLAGAKVNIVTYK